MCRRKSGASATCFKTRACFHTCGSRQICATRCKRAAVAPFIGLDRVVELLDLKPAAGPPHPPAFGRRAPTRGHRPGACCRSRACLLLDEPLASLDASRREEVLPYLETLRDQLAIPMVYVSHNFDEVLRLATHLVLMESGKTIAQGDLGEMSLHPASPRHHRRRRGRRHCRWYGARHRCIERVDASASGPRANSRFNCGDAAPGARLRVQLLARDLIVATEPPRQSSVRNSLPGCDHKRRG